MIVWALSLVFVAFLASGCFHKASLGVWQASEQSLPGSGRVALVGVDDDQAGQVEQLLDERLASFANWDVVAVDEVSPIQQVGYSDQPSIESIVEAATSADIELLISAAVKEATIDAPAAWNAISSNTYARVTLQLTAYATDGAAARVTETITKSKRVPANSETVSGEDFHQLASAAVDEFLSQFRPRNASVKLNLATPPISQSGHWAVRRGNSEAHKGRWGSAAEHYRRAVEANPNCDAALYNLALAAAADRRFYDAQVLARQALSLRHDPVYVAGLGAIVELGSEDRKVRYQTGEANPNEG